MTDITTRAAAFVQKWEAVTINEKATAQEHYIDLCHLLGHPTPNKADPNGDFYRFEKPLTKSGGGAGFADVWKKDHFAWEYKTKGKYSNLRGAYTQLILYKGDLGNPPVLVACDIANYYVSIEFTGYRTRVEQFTNADLQNAATRDLLRLVFTKPEQLRPIERAETITEKAAKQLAHIARLLEDRGFAPVDTAPFFMKVLFALFAEDIRLLPAELMTQSIRQAIMNPGEFVLIAQSLFQMMKSGGYFGPGNKVPRFNGWLFENATALPLNANELQLLNEVAKLDWSSVEPAIFGTLFERSLDPSKRAQLGAHYTSRSDILLIVEPVLMQPYRREWEAVQTGVAALHTQWQTTSGASRQKLRSVAETMIFDFMDTLSKVRVLDPACGSGNFLYVALHQLKDLEQEVWRYAGGLELTQPELGVTPLQLHGIEKNPFAAELAQVVVWIGHLQWLRLNGWLEGQPIEPILQTLHSIECKDAILAFDADGQPVEPEWPAVDVIIGNPPFLDGKKLKGEMEDHYVEAIYKLYKGVIPQRANLVCYWFEQARKQIQYQKAHRAGLLSTQAIRSGDNRKVLEHIKQSGNIFWAWSNREWTIDDAAIRVAMIGFDNGDEQTKMLDGKLVDEINPNLTSNLNLLLAQPLNENQHLASQGMVQRGSFDMPYEVAQEMLKEGENPNGRPNSDVIRPRINANDIAQHYSRTYAVDFGLSMLREDAEKYERPFAYIKEHVFPARQKANQSSARDVWWLYWNTRPALRSAITKIHRYIVTPRVSKYRIFAWVDSHIIPDTRLYVFPREDDYFFGVLHSTAHELWSLANVAWHGKGNDPNYKSSTCFINFPFPWPPGTEPAESDSLPVKAIADAARDLVRLRDDWLNPPAEVLSGIKLKDRTLTNLYNARPDWLSVAHRTLDAAVFAAYGWPDTLSDDEILSRLLALNLERAAGHGAAVPVGENDQADDEEE